MFRQRILKDRRKENVVSMECNQKGQGKKQVTSDQRNGGDIASESFLVVVLQVERVLRNMK
jgi:hypothetical protein